MRINKSVLDVSPCFVQMAQNNQKNAFETVDLIVAMWYDIYNEREQR